MSRNEDRLQKPDFGVTANTGVIPQQNPFTGMVSTELVQLPSQGLFYEEGHPLCNQTEVEIRYMSSVEEDIITNKDLLKSGKAIDRLIQSLLVDKSINIKTLLTGDKNAIMIAARASGFSSEYKTKLPCNACQKINDITIDMDSFECNEILNEYGAANRIPGRSGDFMVTLPKSGLELRCRLLRGDDHDSLFSISQMKKKNKLMETPNQDVLKRMIVSINGNEDKGNIKQFVEGGGLSAMDSRYLKMVYQEMDPSVNTDFIFQCDGCEYHNKSAMPVTTDFFWPTN